MIQIQNTIVSLDVIEEFFCCDLDKCKGMCCVEGDAGAPLTDSEADTITKEYHKASKYMSAVALDIIKNQGVSYIDSEGDRVTSIIGNSDCVFTCHDNGICLCALEKAYRNGEMGFVKPSSCSLYPIRLTEYPTFTAVNLHRWDVCADAFRAGKEKGIRVYEFLKQPLIQRFGKDWWEELNFTAGIYLEEKNRK